MLNIITKLSGSLQHAQESGCAGFSADMQHSVWTDPYPEKTSHQAESDSFVRPIPSKTERLKGLNSYRTPRVPVTCANLPVQVSESHEDHRVISGHVKKNGQVDDFSTHGTDQRSTRPGGVSTVVKKMYESSGDHQSEMGVLAAPPLDTSLMVPHMSKSMSAFEPETNPGKDAEAVHPRPSYSEALDLALVPKKSPAIMDGVTGYKSKAKWNIATYRRDEEAPNLKLTMAQSQESSKSLPLPVTQRLPVTQCVSELAAPRQQMKMTFYRRRGAGMEHVKYTVFLQFLIITALIQNSDGSCSACNDDRCAKVQSIYGSNDTILYQRSNPMENLTSCSTTSAPPPQSQRCVLCLADTRNVILFCSDSWEAAGPLDWEVDGVRLKNIFMVDCPAMKTVPRATGSTMAISVQCPVKRYVVILFQPVTLTCNFQTSATQPPVITWRYKSYCRDPIQAALNPSSADNILSQNNPNYNANIECADNMRTVRIVASKQGSAVTLGEEYQGRKVSILNNADLNLAQTAWGDSGVYVCSVVSAQDLTGNSEDYTELIVLDWLLVVLVVFGFLLLLLLIAICWCQCCPHTCCCYIRCPCCPEKCCCPRALYEAGKAVKSGIPSHYAPTLYAPSMYAQPPYGGGMQQPGIPMLPLPQGMGGPPLHPNGYGRDYDGASSVGQGSQVPLLHDQDSGAGDQTRSGYRIQVDPDGNATRAIYYMERQLANLDPTRAGDAAGKYNRLDGGMSEVSSLHDDPRGRGGGRSQAPPLATVYDQDEAMSTISSVSTHGQRGRDDYPRRGGGPSPHMGAQGRARSMDNLDDIARRDRYPRDPRDPRDDFPPHRHDGGGGARDRRGSDDDISSRGGYDHRRDFDDRRRREPSPDDRRRGGSPVSGLQRRRSRSRDDLMAIERDRERGGGRGGGRDTYDDSFLREAMEKKRLGEQQRARSRERLDSDSERSDRGRAPRGPPPLPMSPPSTYPDRHYDDNYQAPLPPPYVSDDESLTSSKKSNLRKNGAVSRESLVV